MVDIDQYIADFLRDAQFRIAEMGEEMDKLRDKDSPRHILLEMYRLELYQFMDIIYVGYWSIGDPTNPAVNSYNHLDWSDNDIQSEAEYLRNRTEMTTSPFMTFVGNYPQIVDSVSGQTLGGLPDGAPLEFILYDDNGDPVTISFPQQTGMLNGDTPSTFFS